MIAGVQYTNTTSKIWTVECIMELIQCDVLGGIIIARQQVGSNKLTWTIQFKKYFI